MLWRGLRQSRAQSCEAHGARSSSDFACWQRTTAAGPGNAYPFCFSAYCTSHPTIFCGLGNFLARHDSKKGDPGILLEESMDSYHAAHLSELAKVF